MLRAHIDGTAAIVRRDWDLFLSYRFRVASQLLQVVTSLTLFYYVSKLVNVPTLSSEAYFANVAVGLVILQMLTSTIGTVPIGLRQELVAGTFERLVLSPFGAVAGVAATMVFPFVSAAIFGIVTIGVAAAVFGLSLAPTALLAVPVAALGALAFTPFVLAAAASVLVVKQAGVGAGFVVTVISLVSGFFFPTALLPGWLHWAVDVQPFAPALDLMRHLIVGAPLAESAWLILLKLTLFACILIPLGLWLLRKAIAFSRARGTIIEY